MLPHYVEAHEYMPPLGVLRALEDCAGRYDAAVAFREVTPDEILAALRAHPRLSYTIGGTPANALRESLEVKYRCAASRGKTFVGHNELLRLQELGSEPISGVDAHHAGQHFMMYVVPLTLMPVGAVIMHDAQADRAGAWPRGSDQ